MLPVTGPSNMFTYVLADALVQWIFRKAPAPRLRSWSEAGSAASVLEWRSGGGSVFDTTPPHRRHRLLVCQTHQPLFGASFRKYVSQSVGDLASEARTRPAPGPRQGFFSDVTQFDLRTMEPVAGEIGHCFVVGARHQLRASMSAGWRGSAGQVRRNFRQLSPQDNWKKIRRGCRLRRPRHFFPGKNLDLGAGLAGWRLRCRAGSAAGMWRARYRSLRCRAGM